MPIYESRNDRKNERSVAKVLERKFGCDVCVTDTTDEIDFIGYDNEVIRWIGELKCRNVYPDTYDTIFLEKRKRDALEHLAEQSDDDVTPLFIVKFTKNNEIRIFELGKDVNLGKPKRNLGRTDRNDPNDLDTMYLVPVSRMIKI